MKTFSFILSIGSSESVSRFSLAPCSSSSTTPRNPKAHLSQVSHSSTVTRLPSFSPFSFFYFSFLYFFFSSYPPHLRSLGPSRRNPLFSRLNRRRVGSPGDQNPKAPSIVVSRGVQAGPSFPPPRHPPRNYTMRSANFSRTVAQPPSRAPSWDSRFLSVHFRLA